MRRLVSLIITSSVHHTTNEEVRTRIRRVIGPDEDLLTTVKKRKLKWYGHISRSSGLAKTILQGTVTGGSKERQAEEKVGGQHHGVDGSDAE